MEDIGVSLGIVQQILNIFFRVNDTAGIQITGDLLPAQTQVLFRDYNKTTLDMLGHEPWRQRTPANQNLPYILPLIQI